MSTETDPKGLEYWTRLASDNWPTQKGLLFASIAGLIFAVSAWRFFPIQYAILLCALVEALIITAWLLARRLPRCPKNKIGFIVVFECEDPVYRVQFQNDFTTNLRLLLSDGPSSNLFWFCDLSNRPGIRALTAEEARKVRDQTRSHFVLHGRVRSRGKGEEVRHIVDVFGLIWHGQILPHNQRLLANEFRELLPRRVEVRDEGALPAFELSSSLTEIASRYVIAVVMECTGAFEHAEQLFSEAELRGRSPTLSQFPVVRKISARIPTRRMEIAVARGNRAYLKWRETHSADLLFAIDESLETVAHGERHHRSWKVLKAIVEVALRNDLERARELVSSCGKEDPVTRMNLAFLDACGGDLRSAVRHYRAAQSGGIRLDTVEEIMDFIDWYKVQHPHVGTELTFCLAFVACEIEGDRELAGRYFDEFIAQCAGKKHNEQIDLIPKWMGNPEGKKKKREKGAEVVKTHQNTAPRRKARKRGKRGRGN